jgi:protein-L-isoaspartate(D-aspartate) O-methyltransferase
MNDVHIQKYQQVLVDQLKQANHIRTPRVEEAFMTVPRHLFLPDEPLDKVYSDVVIVTKRGEEGQWTSSSSQPSIMAIMLEQLDLQPGQRVLEIGAGTGFNAALIASIVGPAGKVVTVDIQPDLVEHARKCLDVAGYDWVRTVVGDGGYGYPDGAPYDRIILTVASDVITPSWREQLVQDGILVLPFAVVSGHQKSVAFQKRGETLISMDIRPCGFMPLQGAFALAQPVRTPLGPDAGLYLFSEPGKELPVEADTIVSWLRQESREQATGVTSALHELLSDFFPWVELHESQTKEERRVTGSLAAMGNLAEQNRIPSLFGFDGESKAMYAPVMVEAEGMAALTRPPGEIAPLMDMSNPGENFISTFELYLRNFGPGTSAAQRWLKYIQDWDQTGRPKAIKWQIRGVSAETEYQPAEGEFIIDKPWTKLIVSYR